MKKDALTGFHLAKKSPYYACVMVTEEFLDGDVTKQENRQASAGTHKTLLAGSETASDSDV